jgi:hypothetical protein
MTLKRGREQEKGWNKARKNNSISKTKWRR